MKIELEGKIEKIIKKTKKLIKEKGGEFSGNTEQGNFKIKGVHGEYTISNNMLNINIIKKPFILTKGFIESELKKYFKN